MRKIFVVLVFPAALGCGTLDNETKIDRFALVTRHNVTLNAPDTLSALTVGNGEFAFTVDVTGLQTFREEYENGIPLGTQSQWAWHSSPTSEEFILEDVMVDYASCDGSSARYPVQHSEGKLLKATEWLRANPHRLHLGIIGFKLLKSDGTRAGLGDLTNVRQTLDLWAGQIKSTFEIEGVPVNVETYCHQDKDQVAVKVESKLIEQKRLLVELNFPHANDCHVCPGYDFTQPGKHTSTLSSAGKLHLIRRKVDTTEYNANVLLSDAMIEKTTDHAFHIKPSAPSFTFSVSFTRDEKERPEPFEVVQQNNKSRWPQFWTSGGAIDFSDCTDSVAKELERRVVLSQYLTKVQCSGSLPPQETGLTFNSWFGKFHMEMYWWHGAHFPLWGRDTLLEKSMKWYKTAMAKAMHTARVQGYRGARWQKMTDFTGNESPSNVGAFIIWQQPHAIYLAELLYRNNPSKQALEKYNDIVQKTAEFMASFVRQHDGVYNLCHPLIPAQEIFKPAATDNPAYELQYWAFGLRIANEWRKRLGQEPNHQWQTILDHLAPLPETDGFYLPVATAPNAYTDDALRRDHPSVLAAYGFLPFDARLDTIIMKHTLDEVMKKWNWESTWGWDYPMIAMTATRLHQPDLAIQALLMDTQKNTYLKNGHNYQDKRLRIYLPGNGGLLAAMALMTAGWDGNNEINPGFPKDGKWNIRWEGIKRLP